MSLQATDATVVTLGRDHSIIRWDTQHTLRSLYTRFEIFNYMFMCVLQWGAGGGGAGPAGRHRESRPRREVPCWWESDWGKLHGWWVLDHRYGGTGVIFYTSLSAEDGGCKLMFPDCCLFDILQFLEMDSGVSWRAVNTFIIVKFQQTISLWFEFLL